MRTDKKNEDGKLRLVLTHGIGEAFLSAGVDEEVVASFLARAA
jgi:3-dehydroquinate synthetase